MSTTKGANLSIMGEIRGILRTSEDVITQPRLCDGKVLFRAAVDEGRGYADFCLADMGEEYSLTDHRDGTVVGVFPITTPSVRDLVDRVLGAASRYVP